MSDKAKELAETAKSLLNECKGVLSLAEAEVVEAVGHTNLSCLKRRMKELETALEAAAPPSTAPKPTYILGMTTIRKVAELGMLETERVCFVAADDLFHKPPTPPVEIVACECGQALLSHWTECHMCRKPRALATPSPQAPPEQGNAFSTTSAREQSSATASSKLSVAAQAKALAEFTLYFVSNYPGPHTIINDPYWYAPKIFKAAEYAIRAATQEQPAGSGALREALATYLLNTSPPDWEYDKVITMAAESLSLSSPIEPPRKTIDGKWVREAQASSEIRELIKEWRAKADYESARWDNQGSSTAQERIDAVGDYYADALEKTLAPSRQGAGGTNS